MKSETAFPVSGLLFARSGCIGDNKKLEAFVSKEAENN